MKTDIYEFPRVFVTVDNILFTIENNVLKVLLIKRGKAPFKNKWAVPGGFVNMNESLDDAAKRELEEETGMKEIYMEQLYTYGNVKRDPRARVISTVYFALVDSATLQQVERKKKEIIEQKWFSVNELPELAFDHKKIITYAHKRLKYKLEYTTVGLELLPDLFTLTDLQNIYEAILNQKLDKRNFRKKILSFGIIEATTQLKLGPHRPARLYKFLKENIKQGLPGFKWTKLEI
jgi:8-oxo-dGTP diphosphatase